MLSVQCRPGQDIVGPNTNMRTIPWVGSDQECDQRCLETPGCTAWIRPTWGARSPCWMVSGAVTWKSRSDRNAGTPGCTQGDSHADVSISDTGLDEEETPSPSSDHDGAPIGGFV